MAGEGGGRGKGGEQQGEERKGKGGRTPRGSERVEIS